MRTHYCGLVDEKLDGETVTVCGWVHRRRDHGGVIFIDLRDHEGLLQTVFDPDTPETFEIAEQVRPEYVLQIEGRVRPRPEGTVNPDLPTGQVEILGLAITVLNPAETPPFHLDERETVNEVLAMDAHAALDFLQLLCRILAARQREVEEKLVLWKILAQHNQDQPHLA